MIADGVGGWELQGVDSGLFSKQLVADIKRSYDEDPDIDLKTILNICVKYNPNRGSCTCVMVKFDDD